MVGVFLSVCVFLLAQVVCAFWGFVFLALFVGCLGVVCGVYFLFFGACRGFCFVGVVVFGVGFLFGVCGSIVCFVFWSGVCGCRFVFLLVCPVFVLFG